MRLYNNLGVIQVLPLSAQAPMLIVATYNGDEEAGVTWMDYGQIETLHAALGDWLERNKPSSSPNEEPKLGE